MKQKTPLKRTRIRPISERKKHQIELEKPIRKLLAERCGGAWVETDTLIGGFCSGGTCETKGCERRGAVEYYPLFNLHPHENLSRAHGGKLTLWNSTMICNWCHPEKEGIKVIRHD